MITRFAPSPTGYLHVGNARVALINWLFTRQSKGKFLLRIDDTDTMRSNDLYKDVLLEDLLWLGLNWDGISYQSKRMERYQQIKSLLLSKGLIYECYENIQELAIKKDKLIQNNLPPIYDRSSLNLTHDRKEYLKSIGIKPYYRFLLDKEEVIWNDVLRGKLRYSTKHLSDPIVIKSNGESTYMLCSVVDDIDFGITHIIRGEDHISNTAIQIQIFKALGVLDLPKFGHLSLLKSDDNKISKTQGGFSISAIREFGIEAISVNNMLSSIGSSSYQQSCKSLYEILDHFDILSYSNHPVSYSIDNLVKINHKIINSYSYADIADKLKPLISYSSNISENYWYMLAPHLKIFGDIVQWDSVFNNFIYPDVDITHLELIKIAVKHIPDIINDEQWKLWIQSISSQFKVKKNNILKILRFILTGRNEGPELQQIAIFLGRDQILKRLNWQIEDINKKINN
ncbi:glutamate--tRNA ligase [Rickettsia endosymbiont of Cardiosporidium cionae]|uniref:glutamate--tRNA ligase n=1 Tax=Rickettsia endosymbiont of Cardiosporidium cionae TaxID=2777155 RepID=UPI001893AFF6|nr:glutamate--tRNA ligase [Rickettsia endosymbiont of Cardiosporidium cionae]KAF8818392.1 glutamate--tRNA ligase [Rickettsia endosymbiont of Cardiosporidium cionae]